MTFDWSQYLVVAQELAGQTGVSSSLEARLRSAISRAYYSAYCKARNHLRDREGRVIPRRDAHKYVIDEFTGSADSLRRRIGTNLNRLRGDRNRADYNDTFPGLSSKTTVGLTRAQQIAIDVDIIP